MELQLIDGSFPRNEMLDILTQMIDVKIRYHESKIDQSVNEDDIKMREKKIRSLQDELSIFREALQSKQQVHASARITIEN